MKTHTRAGIALLVALAFSAGATPAFADDGAREGEEGRGMLNDTVDAIETAASKETCTDPELSNPLASFGDLRDYFTAPGGDFEDPSAAGWQLSGGAKLVARTHSFAALGLNNAHSLSLPGGAVATSPEFCVDLNYPTFRFMLAQRAAGNGLLVVDVIYPDLAGDEDGDEGDDESEGGAANNVREARRFTLSHSHGWGLSADVPLEPERAGTDPGWRKVALRFRSTGRSRYASQYHIDNILIDPRRRA